MLSNQPRWPNLRSVTLKRCAVDGQFVRILLLNCPVLTRLWFSTVTFEFPPSVPLSNRTLFDFQDTTFSESSHHDAADLMEVHGHTYPYPAIEELGFSHVCGISVFERLNFARQLPNLKQALFINGTYDISHRLPNVLPGFRSLERLRFVQLHSVQQPGDKHPLVALSPTTNLRDLELGGVFIQKDLSLAIRTHSIHLTNLEIENCTLNSEFIGSELMIHTLLGQCSVLKKFVCHSRNVPLYCDPDLFDRYLWASSNLEVLVVAPDCQARPETSSLIPATFTPEQAQEALFRRISSMGQLRELGFAGSVGTRSFFVEPHLDLLKGLHQLEVIDVSSPHLGGLQLTEQHADFMHLEWPKLRAVLGRPPYEYAHFTVQMLTHRPHVVVTHATKGPESRTDQLLHEIGRAEKWRGENE
ncbi:hypothetical protein B0O80DRAFT_475943 [Mortierella sp. GBAus27b]|nr:hypothetical protein B0O80DRAFT_475943 [Mortierella sp. GBAus27b]